MKMLYEKLVDRQSPTWRFLVACIVRTVKNIA